MGDKCRPTHFQKKKPTGTNFLEHEWRISCHQTGTDRQTYRRKPINISPNFVCWGYNKCDVYSITSLNYTYPPNQ